VGLTIFLLSGVLYLLSNSINGLIWISALLGVGAGMIIPLSTALISRFFTGNYRTKQFGLVSAISNLTLVVATALTGYLAEINWKLPFTVYLLPVVSLILLPGIYNEEKKDGVVKGAENSVGDKKVIASGNIMIGPLLGNMWYYFFITYIVLIISLNLPFLLENYGYRSDSSGVLISVFFLAIMLPGFFIGFFKRFLGKGVRFFPLLIMAAGLALLLAFRTLPTMVLGCFIAGFGYGIAQPLVYDSTVAETPASRASFALAWVMVMNYVAILLAPFVMDAMQMLFHTKSQQFPFAMNMIVSAFFAVVYFFGRK
jgi:MFS family permease